MLHPIASATAVLAMILRGTTAEAQNLAQPGPPSSWYPRPDGFAVEEAFGWVFGDLAPRPRILRRGGEEEGSGLPSECPVVRRGLRGLGVGGSQSGTTSANNFHRGIQNGEGGVNHGRILVLGGCGVESMPRRNFRRDGPAHPHVPAEGLGTRSRGPSSVWPRRQLLPRLCLRCCALRPGDCPDARRYPLRSRTDIVSAQNDVRLPDSVRCHAGCPVWGAGRRLNVVGLD